MKYVGADIDWDPIPNFADMTFEKDCFIPWLFPEFPFIHWIDNV